MLNPNLTQRCRDMLSLLKKQGKYSAFCILNSAPGKTDSTFYTGKHSITPLFN
jgi:hypothetical protein